MRIILLALFLIPVSFAYAENIIYTNAVPQWYSYTCTSGSPGTWTQADPDANQWKYFNYFLNSACYGNMFTFDLNEISDIYNATEIIHYIDTNGVLVTDRDLSNNYNVPCDLLFFGDISAEGTTLIKTPVNMTSFSCSGSPPQGIVQEISYNFTQAHIDLITDNIADGNYTLSFMIFPHFNNTMRTNLINNNYEYGTERHQNDLSITGGGFDCVVIRESNFCNLFNDPWTAVGKALGSDIIGDWFYVIVFFPIPMCIFLATRTGLYAGFVGLGIMLVIETIDQTVFEISLSMIAICAGFGFYDIIRKRLFD